MRRWFPQSIVLFLLVAPHHCGCIVPVRTADDRALTGQRGPAASCAIASRVARNLRPNHSFIPF